MMNSPPIAVCSGILGIGADGLVAVRYRLVKFLSVFIDIGDLPVVVCGVTVRVYAYDAVKIRDCRVMLTFVAIGASAIEI